MGADPDAVRRGGLAVRRKPAARFAAPPVLAVQGAISATFIIFIVATSNPFPAHRGGARRRQRPQPDPCKTRAPPSTRRCSTPGYVGFSMAFSFAIAALILGRVDSAWARWVRPWTLRGLDIPHHRHRRRLVVGVRHARLGRLVVLGPGRERLVDAVACGNGALAFRHRHGEAQQHSSHGPSCWRS